MFRRKCPCERLKRDLHRQQISLEKMQADIEGEVLQVIDLRKRIQADIRNLGKRERALEARRTAVDERAQELDLAETGQLPLTPPLAAHTTGATAPIQDRASRKADILRRMKGA